MNRPAVVARQEPAEELLARFVAEWSAALVGGLRVLGVYGRPNTGTEAGRICAVGEG